MNVGSSPLRWQYEVQHFFTEHIDVLVGGTIRFPVWLCVNVVSLEPALELFLVSGQSLPV